MEKIPEDAEPNGRKGVGGNERNNFTGRSAGKTGVIDCSTAETNIPERSEN